jgi:hypothetical protein
MTVHQEDFERIAGISLSGRRVVIERAHGAGQWLVRATLLDKHDKAVSSTMRAVQDKQARWHRLGTMQDVGPVDITRVKGGLALQRWRMACALGAFELHITTLSDTPTALGLVFVPDTHLHLLDPLRRQETTDEAVPYSGKRDPAHSTRTPAQKTNGRLHAVLGQLKRALNNDTIHALIHRAAHDRVRRYSGIGLDAPWAQTTAEARARVAYDVDITLGKVRPPNRVRRGIHPPATPEEALGDWQAELDARAALTA